MLGAAARQVRTAKAAAWMNLLVGLSGQEEAAEYCECLDKKTWNGKRSKQWCRQYL